MTRVFVVRNSGNAPLTLRTPTLPPGFSLGSDPLVTTLAPGKSDSFDVKLKANLAPGIKSGEISIGNDDSDENPFNFAIKGEVKAYSIKGNIKYHKGNPKPVRGALVRAWDANGLPDTFIGETYTDDKGNYEIKTIKAGTDIYLRVYAQTAPAGTGTGTVKRAVLVEDGLTGADYYRQFTPIGGSSLGGTSPQLAATLVIEDWSYSEQAFWAFDAAVTASRFHATLPAVTAGSFEIQFPNPLEYPLNVTSAAYGGNIYLHSNDWKNWDVIIHEYGHLVAGEAGFFSITGAPIYWPHWTGRNARVVSPTMDYDDMMELAFNEGWANFYSMVCQHCSLSVVPRLIRRASRITAVTPSKTRLK